MLDQVDALVAAWRWDRADRIEGLHLPVLTAPHRQAIRALLQSPSLDDPPAEALRRDLIGSWEALWTVIQVEGAEPTTNATERMLRPGVRWRKGCYGTQSPTGSRFVERLLSVVATGRQQGRDVLAFLRAAVIAAWTYQWTEPCSSLDVVVALAVQTLTDHADGVLEREGGVAAKALSL